MTLTEIKEALVALANKKGIPHFTICAAKHIHECHVRGIPHWALSELVAPETPVPEERRLLPELEEIVLWVDGRKGRLNEMARTGLVSVRYFTALRQGEHVPTKVYMAKIKRAAVKVAESERIRGICNAVRVNDQFVCGKCGVQWDFNEDYLPPCKSFGVPPKGSR